MSETHQAMRASTSSADDRLSQLFLNQSIKRPLFAIKAGPLGIGVDVVRQADQGERQLDPRLQAFISRWMTSLTVYFSLDT